MYGLFSRLRSLQTQERLRPFKMMRQCFRQPQMRRMATHRETERNWRPIPRPGFWSKYRVPILFTVGVMAVDWYVIPRLVDMSPWLRRHPESIVYGIIAANIAGFVAWRMPGAPQRFMYRYGLLQKIPNRFNVWQMIGSAFSHQNAWHIGINMFVLWQFATPVAYWLGSGHFLQAYLDGCVLSSLGSMLLPLLFKRWVSPSGLPSLGASGAVFTAMGVFSYLAPHARLALWFIPLPIGAWTVFLLTLAYNTAAISGRFGLGRNLDYAGHVAGSLVGIGYGYWVQRRRERRIRSQPRPRLF